MSWILIMAIVIALITLVCAFGTPTLPSLPAGAGASTRTWLGANWKFLMGIAVVVLIGWHFKWFSVSPPNIAHASGSFPQKHEVYIPAEPHVVSRRVDIQREFGPGRPYKILHGNKSVWIYVDDEKTPVLDEPFMPRDFSRAFYLSFKSPGTNTVDVFLRAE